MTTEPHWDSQPGNGEAAEQRREQRPSTYDIAATRWGAPPAPREPLLVRALTGTVRLSVGAVKLPLRVARPVIMSRAMTPARNAANAAVGAVSFALSSVIAEELIHNTEVLALIDAVAQRLLTQLAKDPLVTQLIASQAGGYLKYLTTNAEQISPLVQVAATDFLTSLEEQPELLDPLVRAVAQRYIDTLATQPEGVKPLVEAVAAEYINTLGQQPELLDQLVEEAANRFMLKVRQDPAEVNRLVQVVGDQYMDYLNKNPDDVQQLLAGQTASMTKEIVEEVREQSSVADNALENRVRSLLGLKPRSSLPAGPDKIAP